MKTRSDVTVIIPAYTEKRWDLTCLAIESVLAQEVLPAELLICIDHNRELFDRFNEHLSSLNRTAPRIRVLESKYDGHAAASRTTALEMAIGEYVVYLDDDAAATPGWLEAMLATLEKPGVIAVGGAPIPVYSKKRPIWFPFEFDWIFGCAYEGLPQTTESVLHLIGTTIAARKRDLLAIGGFRFDVFEDMDMCHRLLKFAPDSKLIYEPSAVVNHYVHEDRLHWHYFWRRIFWVNRVKVSVMKGLGDGANLKSERNFALRTLLTGPRRELSATLHGDLGGLLRAMAILFGFGLAGVGYVVGLIQWNAGRIRSLISPSLLDL